jgi:hypothetical protein
VAGVRLELAHEDAHSRLRDEQLLGGAREALVLRREKEGLELPRGDIHGERESTHDLVELES